MHRIRYRFVPSRRLYWSSWAQQIQQQIREKINLNEIIQIQQEKLQQISSSLDDETNISLSMTTAPAPPTAAATSGSQTTATNQNIAIRARHMRRRLRRLANPRHRHHHHHLRRTRRLPSSDTDE